MSVSEKSLQKIIKENIHPKSKWEFIVREIFIWCTLVFFAILSGLALSVATAVLNKSDLDLHNKFNKSFVDYLLENFPYALLLIAVIFIIVILINIKNTKTGYRHRSISLIMITVGSTLILCGVFTVVGLGDSTDTTLERTIQGYMNLKATEDDWNHPELGLLSGVVWKINNQKNFILVDEDDNLWVIDTINIPIKSKMVLRPGREVKVIGRLVDEQFFKAQEVRLWRENPLRGVMMHINDQY